MGKQIKMSEQQTELTLETGRKVTIYRPTVRQRIEANDAANIVQTEQGMMVQNVYMQTCKWAAFGLRVELDDLDEYNDSEIAEIAKATRELSELDPTKKQG